MHGRASGSAHQSKCAITAAHACGRHPGPPARVVCCSALPCHGAEAQPGQTAPDHTALVLDLWG
eukprot:5284750-Amphidinium_carterae.1